MPNSKRSFLILLPKLYNVDFGKYIHELLLENEMVIIPGLGAFISEYKPAEISEDSDEMRPPSKLILFNQQIKNNDGLLVTHIALTKQISNFDAFKEIEKERENILYKLDSGEHVRLNKLGFLFYNDTHTIEFKAEQDENLALDSFGLENTAISVSGKTVSEKTEKKKAVKSKEKKDKAPTSKTSAIIEQKKTIPVPPTKQTVLQEEEKKKKGWWWLLLVLIPLLVVSIFVFMKNQKEEITNKGKEGTISILEKPKAALQDSLKNDSVDIEEIDTAAREANEQGSTVINDTDAPKYYLVGGSFSIEENAETFLQELKDKGFDAFHVGKKGRFFIVGIGSYDTFEQADEAKQAYMANYPDSEVWVYKK